MPTAQQPDIGAFSYGVARLTVRGDLEYETGGLPSALEDEYAVVMASDDRPTLETVSGLPGFGAAAGTSGGLESLIVDRISFRHAGQSSRVWKISVRYVRNSGDSDEEPDAANAGLLDVSWGTSESSADVVADADDETGAPLLNSAGDAFDTVPQKTCYGSSVTVIRKERDFPATAYSKNGCVNSAAVKICNVDFPAHSAMLKVSVKENADEDFPFVATYQIDRRVNVIAAANGEEARDIGWDVAFLQCGFQYLETSEGQTVKRKFVVEDESGTLRDVSTPQPLDENGAPSEKAAVRVVRVYPVYDFAALKLPKTK